MRTRPRSKRTLTHTREPTPTSPARTAMPAMPANRICPRPDCGGRIIDVEVETWEGRPRIATCRSCAREYALPLPAPRPERRPNLPRAASPAARTEQSRPPRRRRSRQPDALIDDPRWKTFAYGGLDDARHALNVYCSLRFGGQAGSESRRTLAKLNILFSAFERAGLPLYETFPFDRLVPALEIHQFELAERQRERNRSRAQAIRADQRLLLTPRWRERIAPLLTIKAKGQAAKKVDDLWAVTFQEIPFQASDLRDVYRTCIRYGHFHLGKASETVGYQRRLTLLTPIPPDQRTRPDPIWNRSLIEAVDRLTARGCSRRKACRVVREAATVLFPAAIPLPTDFGRFYRDRRRSAR